MKKRVLIIDTSIVNPATMSKKCILSRYRGLYFIGTRKEFEEFCGGIAFKLNLSKERPLFYAYRFDRYQDIESFSCYDMIKFYYKNSNYVESCHCSG